MDWAATADVAIAREEGPRATWLREKIYGETRAMWSLYSDLDSDSRVLVLDTQWGGTIIALIEFVSSVVVVPANEAAELAVRSRLRDTDSEAVELVAPGIELPLGFDDASFDAVVIAPPLEDFLARQAAAGNSARRLFHEVRRVLTAQGCLHFVSSRVPVGTNESRFVRAVQFARSALSDARALNRTRLLRDCGFGWIQFLGAETEVGFAGRLDPKGYAPVPTIKNTCSAIRTELRYPAGLHLVWAEAPKNNYMKRLAAVLDLPDAVQRRVSVSGTGMMNAELVSRDGSERSELSGIVRVPFSKAGAPRVQNNAKCLAELEVQQTKGLKLPAHVPKVLKAGRFRARQYSFESKIPGEGVMSFDLTEEERQAVRNQAGDFLIALHSGTANVTRIEGADLQKLFVEPVQRLEGFARDGDDHLRLRLIQDYLTQVCDGAVLPLVFSHGDFWEGNLLLQSTTKQVISVVDWDMARPRGLPLLDVLNMLLLSARHHPDGRNPYEHLFDYDWTRADIELVDRYCMALNISPALRTALAITTWTFELGSLQWRSRMSPPTWLEAKLHRPLELAASRLGMQGKEAC